MESQTIDLKQTVNLPKTDFPMKANLPQSEPKTLARWEENDLYGQIRKARAGRPRFVLHDGPPYANGNIHLGHALNKTLKDFIVKTKTMQGFDSPYVPGWDCHGLPIEIKVDGELGSKKAKMTVGEIRRECRKYAAKFVELQSKDFQRLGIFGRWKDPYLTMAPAYQSVIAGAFVDFLHQGFVYKGLKPVNWCPQDRTALAEAEVEYENHTSPSIWVRFALTSNPEAIDPVLAGKQVYGLIWTTTPWTIPANMGISFHPRFEYAAVEVGGAVYIVASDLLEATAAKCGWSEKTVLTRFAGEVLDRTVFRHPFLERDSLGMVGNHVTLEQGTGAVHTAPGHGNEDYVVGRQYGIATYCPVDGAGRFFHAEGADGRLPEVLIGKSIWEANPLVMEILREAGTLLHQEPVHHSYPHCWRCHKPTIFRATDQWFIGMDRKGLRENALAAIKKVRWMPSWGEERISNMIATRPDWCISRQRIWGVPIIAFYCRDCREPYTERAALDAVVAQFREHSADVWYDRTAAELMPAGARCGKCGCEAFEKENDILDVWFDSGSSHLAVLTPENDLPWPSDVYLEGGDQYRGWFHSSLLVGVGLRGSAPYRQCATNGWTLDGEGRAMSKSLGNVIEPEKIIKQYGAEVLRLWVASVEFTEDVRLTDTMLVRLSEAYRKIRNTFRYALGNLYDFDPATDAVDGSQLHGLDQWILVKTAELCDQTVARYDEYAFHKAYQALYAFSTVELSALYFDILKDRLYTSAPKSPARRSAQTALYRITDALVRLIAPVLPFTCDEVWASMRREGSVHTAEFPKAEELLAGLAEQARASASEWDRILEIRDTVLKHLDTARQEKVIGAPLEAKVALRAFGEQLELLRNFSAHLPAVFIVSKVTVDPGAGNSLDVSVERAGGQKCERCWKYTDDVGCNAMLPTVCAPCAAAVAESLSR